MSETIPPQYRENASQSIRGTWLKKWTTGDVVVLTASIFAFLVLLESVNIGFALLGGLLLVLLNVPFFYGHLWYDIAVLVQGVYIRVVLGGKLYVNPREDTSRRWVRWLRQKRYRRPENRYVFPIHLTVVDARGTQYGIIQQVDRPFDHIPVRGHNSDFSSLDHQTRDFAVAKLASSIDELSMLAREQWGLKLGISHVRLSRPVNETQIGDYYLKSGHPAVFEPDYFELTPEQEEVMAGLRENVDQIVPTLQAYGVADSWQLMLPTVKRTREMERAMKHKLDDESLYDLRLIEMGRKIVEAIANSGMNVRRPHCLSYLEVCQLIRAGWDVRNLDFLGYKGDGKIVLVTQEDVDDPDSPYGPEDIGTIMEPFETFPTESIEAGSDYICLDGNWISSFMLTRQPERYNVSDVQYVYHDESPAGVWSSIASAGETISGSIQTNILVYKGRITGGLSSWWNPDPDGVIHPKTRRKRQAQDQEIQTMGMSSLAQRYNEVVTVVAPTKEAMIAGRSAVMAQMENRGYKCRLVNRTALQMSAAITGIYGINRL
jgi:hypothetical protein